MKVAIIGAGTMGSGIAQTFATHKGYEVILCDLSNEFADKGKKNIEKNLAKLVAKGKMEQTDMDASLSVISTGTNDAAAAAELVIEAAVEKMSLKSQILRELSEKCGSDTIFATNTSSLSITELSAAMGRPLAGMHFFNPAPVMKLVEVIAGLTTPPELTEKIIAIAADLGKTPVKVKDSAGFVVNRILIPMINEAAGIFSEGIATAEDIDSAMKLGAGHPMGALELGDLIGLDVCLAIMDVLYENTLDSKYRAYPILRQYVRAGWLGKKTGRGFYNYG